MVRTLRRATIQIMHASSIPQFFCSMICRWKASPCHNYPHELEIPRNSHSTFPLGKEFDFRHFLNSNAGVTMSTIKCGDSLHLLSYLPDTDCGYSSFNLLSNLSSPWMVEPLLLTTNRDDFIQECTNSFSFHLAAQYKWIFDHGPADNSGYSQSCENL